MSPKQSAIQHTGPVTQDVVRNALREQNVDGLDDVVRQAVKATQSGHMEAGENSLWIAYRSDKWYAVGPGIIESR
jgi:hypothetical protein